MRLLPRGATVALVVLTAGCSSTTSTSPSPSTSATTQVSTTAATPSAAATPAAVGVPTPTASPAATTAGDLDASVFTASVLRWKAVKGEGDEGTYQPNGSWVHALDAAQATESLRMQACATAPSLPTPQHVLASDYEDPGQHRAVAQALRFRSAAEATAFVQAYTSLVRTCVGRSNPMSATLVQTSPVLVDRRTMTADATHWVEAVRAHGTLVRMIAANEQDQPLTKAELATLAAAV